LAIARFVGQRFRLEFPVGKVLYDTAGWVSHIRVSPAGDRVAFLDHPIFGDDRGMVAVVDLAGNKEVISTGTFASIQGLSWSPSGKEVWFTGSESGLNTALYAATLKQRQRVVLRSPGRLILQDVTRDGRVLMSREAARQVLLLVGPGQERDLSLLDWSVAGALSSDGQQLLFSEQGDGGGPYYSVYLRKTDGSAPVRLGDGAAVALSPDSKWALAMMPTPPAQYFLLPTGAGEARQMTNDTIAHSHGVAAWLPKGKEVVFEGTEQGGKPLTYVQDVENGKPRVVGPGGLPQIVISPDGKSVVLKDEHDKFAIYPLQGGQPIPIANLGQRDVPIAWSSDGNSILVTSSSGLPVVVDRVDVRAGRRTRFKEFMPSDSAGIARVAGALATPDGRYLVFNLSRILSDLYVVHGLK
jgi:eukaryotic-like serine/threonine-protein kinase